MAAVNTNSVAAFVSGKGLIATTFEAFQRWNDVRRTRAVLSKLSDRELMTSAYAVAISKMWHKNQRSNF